MPITPHILQLLYQTWARPPLTADNVMLWAACCFGFFGFFRAGEFTCPSLAAYVPTMLSPRDIQVDSHDNPSYIRVNLRHNKTDTFSAGVSVLLGRVAGPVCPVKSLLGYLLRRGLADGPLFLFEDGSTLSRSRLVNAVRSALADHGMDVTLYNGHSFRIGAATAAAASGMEDSLIRTLGRWNSSAFTAYIRTPRDTLTSVSSRLMDAESQ